MNEKVKEWRILRPSKYYSFEDPTKNICVDPNNLFSGVKKEDIPKFCVALDGKPSDTYTGVGNYCLAILSATDITKINDVGKTIEQKIETSGFKFKKLATVRSKKLNDRKARYIHLILDALIEISKEMKGLPFNSDIVLSPNEMLNPASRLEFIRNNNGIKAAFGITEMTDTDVKFNLNGKVISIGNNDFGAMCWWHVQILQKILRIFKIEFVTQETSINGWVHLDRLPRDLNCERTMLFARMLNWTPNFNLWVDFNVGHEMYVDVMTDFYANIFYDFKYNKRSNDSRFMEKFKTLQSLNSKMYWETTIR